MTISVVAVAIAPLGGSLRPVQVAGFTWNGWQTSPEYADIHIDLLSRSQNGVYIMVTKDDYSVEILSDDTDLDEGHQIDGAVNAFDAVNADDDAFFIREDGAIVSCTRPWTGWYRKNRSVWKICKDSDGYRVITPGGSTSSWGKGYSWNDVKSAYGLSGIRAYTSTCGPACF